MNSDLVLGYAQTMSGRMVELTGWVLSKPALEQQGRAHRAIGELRHGLGRARVVLKAHGR